MCSDQIRYCGTHDEELFLLHFFGKRQPTRAQSRVPMHSLSILFTMTGNRFKTIWIGIQYGSIPYQLFSKKKCWWRALILSDIKFHKSTAYSVIQLLFSVWLREGSDEENWLTKIKFLLMSQIKIQFAQP